MGRIDWMDSLAGADTEYLKWGGEFKGTLL